MSWGLSRRNGLVHVPALLATCWLATVRAETPPTEHALPDPLTLDYALSLAEEAHPTLALSRARLAEAKAEHALASADDDVYANLELNARYIEPAERTVKKQHNDSRAILSVQKRLYDFGRTRNAVDAAVADVRGSEWLYEDDLGRHRVEIMQRFFEVILADLEYARDNEDMSTAFIAWDRARDRNELGQVSDIDVLQLEDAYQETRLRRYGSDVRRRTTRARLAQVLNRPDDLPSELIAPALPGNDAQPPEYEPLMALALKTNPRLLAMREQLEAAQHRIEASRMARRPVLSTEVELAEWEREVGNREPFGASLILDVPLYQGGRVNADLAKQKAESYYLQAQVQQYEYDLRQGVLETWQDIQTLNARREQALVKTDYRDLYLDRSRARYELEIEADLGDAMGEQTNARLFATRTEFELALAWAHLALLTGEPGLGPLTPPGQKPVLQPQPEASP